MQSDAHSSKSWAGRRLERGSEAAHRVRPAGVTDLVTEHRVENVLALRRLSKVRYHGLQSRCFDEGYPRLCCRNEWLHELLRVHATIEREPDDSRTCHVRQSWSGGRIAPSCHGNADASCQCHIAMCPCPPTVIRPASLVRAYRGGRSGIR